MNTSTFITNIKIISNSDSKSFISRMEKITPKYKIKGLLILALSTILIAGCATHQGMNKGSGGKGHANHTTH